LKEHAAVPSIDITGDEALRLILREKLSSGGCALEAAWDLKKPKPDPWKKFKFGKALYQRQNLPKLSTAPFFSNLPIDF
jgi:hypothetical protein